MYSLIKISMILKVCLFLWTIQLVSVTEVLLPTTTTITGASLCLSRSETCILLKACNFKLLNQTLPAGACIEGTSQLFANFSSFPPTLGLKLNMVRVNFKKQCDCSACKDLCSTNQYSNMTRAPQKNSKSSCHCKTGSSPPEISTQPFRLDSFEFEVTANTCLALSKDNNCLLGKFCDIRLNGIQQGDVIPPVCIQGSATIISYFDLEMALMDPSSILQMLFFKFSDDFQTQKSLSGADTLCSCSACNKKCTTNPLSPAT